MSKKQRRGRIWQNDRRPGLLFSMLAGNNIVQHGEQLFGGFQRRHFLGNATNVVNAIYELQLFNKVW